MSCYWPVHKELMAVGVDGWWPDQGDGFDGPSRFNRHCMYWEGTQLYRPNQRPFALHRNASPGVQRYGGFIWSGDVRSRWETLATHIAVAVNTGLSGLPYWGTDIGGFNPTEEYTAELHVRWFQFGAFSPSFRAHGRNWRLKLPWGWHGGDGGPMESRDWRPPSEELNRPEVSEMQAQYQRAIAVPLTQSTSDTVRLTRAALWGLKRIFKPGYAYQKAGVMLMEISPAAQTQGVLFGPSNAARPALMQVIDRANALWGSGTLKLAAEGVNKSWYMKRDHKSPGYTTDWTALPRAY